MSWLFVYLLVKLTSISVFFSVLSGTLGSGAFMGTIGYVITGDVDGWKKVEKWKSPLKKLWIATLITGFLAAVTPTTKQAAVIWLLPKVVNNEQVQAVPEKALRLLNQQMDQWLEDNLKIEDKQEKE